MSFEIITEKVHGNTSTTLTHSGTKSLYEETYDGTHAGWFKFRKDVATTAGLKSEDWVLEVQDHSATWQRVDGAEALEGFLEAAAKSGKLLIRVHERKNEKKEKPAKVKGEKKMPSKERDVEKGHTEHGSSSHSSECACCKCLCWPVKLALLIIIYALLFGFWVVGLIVAFLIELFWLPFKCLCPVCCPCFCCAEAITKDIFGLVLWVLKLPVTIAKKILA